MSWARRSLVGLLSLVLLIALVGCALAASVVLNLSQPARIEGWLNDSKLYDQFIGTTIDGTGKTTGSSVSSDTGASPATAAVRNAAESAFPPQLLRQNTRTFIDSNYAWLQGKTDKPEFTIDLSEAKQNFAKQVGDYVRQYSARLPVCTAAQLSELQYQSPDLLTATCRPPDSTPEALGAETTRRLSSSGDFLSNPVITAKSLNPKDDKGGSRPYYEKLETAPEAYKLGQKMPWILGALAILTMAGIILLAPRKRRGIRRIAVVFAAAGVILIAVKFVADFGFRRVEQRVFNQSTDGQLEQSLTDFAHRVEAALVKTDLWFGLAFLAIALIILVVMLKTRASRRDNPHPTPRTPSAPPPAPEAPSTSVQESYRPQPTTAPPLKKRPPRPPRLIQ